MFWKKDDDFDFKSISNDPLGSTPMHEDMGGIKKDPFSQDPLASKPPSQTNFSQPAPPPPEDSLKPDAFNKARQESSSRDLELISSKLDTIKALLQSLDSRVSDIERIAKQEEQIQNKQQQQQQGHKLW
tara:strand:+ start:169 stop:555 length:387 start_codon:yes stop_codon:yes gene_type:complete